MTERREILGRASMLFVMIEGGPGAGHEAETALANAAMVIPVGRSGGYAASLYSQMQRPSVIDYDTWQALGADEASPEQTALAILSAVQACLELDTLIAEGERSTEQDGTLAGDEAFLKRSQRRATRRKSNESEA
jgi:hypothetical protein